MIDTVTSAAAGAAPVDRDRSRRRAIAVGTLAVLVGAGAARGGYFPGAWGWIALACAWAAGLLLVLDEDAALGRAGAAVVVAATGLLGWTLLSAVWSVDPTQTVLEAERTLVYVAGLLALLLAARRSFEAVATAVWGAASLLAGWGLLTRLLPERLGVTDVTARYRLGEPIGYWNALGLLCAIGLLVGLAVATRSRAAALRAAAGASIVVLALTLYFTYGRGAWISLAAGLLVAFALDRRRLELLAGLAVAGPWAAAAIAIGAHQSALVTAGARLADRSREGHRLLAIAVVVAGGAAVSAVVRPRLAPAGGAGRRTHVALACAAAAAVLAGGTAMTIRYGAPWHAARHAWTSFSTGGSGVERGNLNSRLFKLGGSGRGTQWHVAWREVEAHPWLGSGAGTYERYWNRQRPSQNVDRDAHSLYLETLAELGPPGLALLAVLLLLPFAGVARARARELGPVVAGAYVAYLLHAAADWDWELTSVTLVGLACGAALLSTPAPRVSGRRVALGFAALLAGASIYGIATRYEQRQVDTAAARGDWPAARHAVGRAAALQPWSAEPWQSLAEAELAAGRLAAAQPDIRRALGHDRGSWELWLDLARATDGRTRASALARARRLNPRSPEVHAFLATLQSLSAIDAGTP